MSELSALPKCDNPECPGHLSKFDSCIAEAIYYSSLNDGGGDGSTGTGDFEGHYTLYVVRLEEEADGERVAIPAGNYVLHEASSGQVSLWKYDTPELAQAEFDAAEARYDAWDDQS